jgi:hypothetical protein
MILAELARLQARLPVEERVRYENGFTLQRYLDNLTSYAESSMDVSDVESERESEDEVSSILMPSNEITTPGYMEGTGSSQYRAHHKQQPSANTADISNTANTGVTVMFEIGFSSEHYVIFFLAHFVRH